MNYARMIQAVDAHACGEPGRVIIGGVIDVPGATMLEKMCYFQENRDGLRKLMLREPRGYPAYCCNLILPPTRPDADAGFIIMEQTEYPGMSGTNTICVATVLLETGMVPMHEPVTELNLDTPAGLIHVKAECSNGRVKQVTFENVPAFAVYIDTPLEVPNLGTVKVDVAYGGMFYVISDASQFGLRLLPEEGKDIVRIGEMIKTAAQAQLPVVHPDQPKFTGITIGQLSGPPDRLDADCKNSVVVSTGKLDWNHPATWTGSIDRSPCGTGTCAKMAVLYAKGQIGLNEDFRHEGILGTIFTGRLIRETKVGQYRAVVPTISGQAWITGIANYIVEDGDPFPEGYTLGDIW